MGLLGARWRRIADAARGRGQRRGRARACCCSSEAQQTLPLRRCAGAAGAVAAARLFGAGEAASGVPLERLRFLALHDTDPFNRWEAGQQVATRILLGMVAACRRGRGSAGRSRARSPCCARRSTTPSATPLSPPRLLTLPSEAFLADQLTMVDVDAIHAAREARAPRSAARSPPNSPRSMSASPIPAPIASTGCRSAGASCATWRWPISRRRAARPGVARAKAQFDAGGNMTDVLAALGVLGDIDHPARAEALGAFYARWQGDDLVDRQMVRAPGDVALPGTLARVRALTRHPAFDIKNAEPRARAGLRLRRRQSGALPRPRAAPATLPRRPGAGARSAQSADGGAAGAAAGPMAAPRRGAPGADAARARARAGHCPTSARTPTRSRARASPSRPTDRPQPGRAR